jgi:hypothetical protein
MHVLSTLIRLGVSSLFRLEVSSLFRMDVSMLFSRPIDTHGTVVARMCQAR